MAVLDGTRWQCSMAEGNPAAQRQTAIAAHFLSRQLLLFVFARRSVLPVLDGKRESGSSKAKTVSPYSITIHQVTLHTVPVNVFPVVLPLTFFASRKYGIFYHLKYNHSIFVRINRDRLKRLICVRAKLENTSYERIKPGIFLI